MALAITSLNGEAISGNRNPNISVTDIPSLSLRRLFCPSSSFTPLILLTSSLPFPLFTLPNILLPSLSLAKFFSVFPLIFFFFLPSPCPIEPLYWTTSWSGADAIVEQSLSGESIVHFSGQMCVFVPHSRCICILVFLFPKFVCRIYTQLHNCLCVKMSGIWSEFKNIRNVVLANYVAVHAPVLHSL